MQFHSKMKWTWESTAANQAQKDAGWIGRTTYQADCKQFPQCMSCIFQAYIFVSNYCD